MYSNNLAIIVQGPLNKIGLDAVEYYSKFGEVIVSYWDNDDESIIDENINAKFVKQSIETATELPIPNRQFASICYQSSTTLHGLKHTDAEWAIKVRSDESYKDLTAFIRKMYDNPDKIVTGNVFFKTHHRFKYHIGDHLIGGKSSNLRGMFRETLYNFNNGVFLKLNKKYKKRMSGITWGPLCPESMLAVSYLFFLNIPRKDIFGDDSLEICRQYFDVVPIDCLDAQACWRFKDKIFTSTRDVNVYLSDINKDLNGMDYIISNIDQLSLTTPPKSMKKFNLLLPIAGRAQRFLDAGYNVPKPMIMADNKFIINWALDSIDTSQCNLIFIVRLDHVYNFSLDKILKSHYPDAEIVTIDHVTEGAPCTCLLAKEFIDNDDPLIIYTPDVHFLPQFDPATIDESLDGFLLTFQANSPAHSYAQLDDDGYVVKTAEKQIISHNAAIGVYYYKKGSRFVTYAEDMISSNLKINNEFYICPIYNYMIKDNLKVKTQQMDKMHVLGTPADLEFFIDRVVPKFGDKPVALTSDHSGYDGKEAAKNILRNHDIEYVDFGTHINKSCDYADYVSQAIRAVDFKQCDFVFGFCRTGQGVNILANKSYGISAALISDEYTTEYAVRHNCANFFSIPTRYVNEELFDKMVQVLKTASFDGGRHFTRMKAALC